MIEQWLELTEAPSDRQPTKLVLQSVVDLREFLRVRGVEPWSRVNSDRAAEAGALRDGRELRDEMRRVCESFEQLVGEVVRFALPYAP